MWRVPFWLGVGLTLLTFAAWYLLSGFGCEMNTSGCRTIRLDWSRDALRIFLPALAIGAALVLIGLGKRNRVRRRDG